jgi:hypothetical protein
MSGGDEGFLPSTLQSAPSRKQPGLTNYAAANQSSINTPLTSVIGVNYAASTQSPLIANMAAGSLQLSTLDEPVSVTIVSECKSDY